MKGFFVVLALCVVGLYASPINNRVANGTPNTDAAHACIILVIRPDIGPNQAALGGGSIISPRHVLTCAVLVRGHNNFQLAFRATGNLRRVDATFAVTHENFNPQTLENDIAMIFLPVNASPFPLINAISIAGDVTVPAPNTLSVLVGFGFTSPTSNTVSQIGFSANQTVATDAACTAAINRTASHFCAIDNVGIPPAAICPGDNGSGLYLNVSGTTPTDPATKTLIGIVSMLSNLTCTTAAQVGYTRVSMFEEWITNLAGLGSGIVFKK